MKLSTGKRWNDKELAVIENARKAYPDSPQRELANELYYGGLDTTLGVDFHLTRSFFAVYFQVRELDAELVIDEKFLAEMQRSASLSIVANPKKVI